MKRVLREAVEWAVTIIVAFVVFLLIRQYVLRTAVVNGSSMAPTLSDGDRILIGRFFYYLEDPDYGEIVAFPYHEAPTDYYIKRIIGLPGDTINLSAGEFTVNGVILADAFSEEIVSAYGDVSFPITVPENRYFVLGDNRNSSKDSRYGSVGFIDKSEFIGKAFFRLTPLGLMGGLR